LKIKVTRVFVLLFCCYGAQALANSITIYHDADYSIHAESAHSMAMGFKTALAEVGNRIQGYDIDLVVKDHRGNSKRSLHHMRTALYPEPRFHQSKRRPAAGALGGGRPDYTLSRGRQLGISPVHRRHSGGFSHRRVRDRGQAL
jgi:hypothetical protein